MDVAAPTTLTLADGGHVTLRSPCEDDAPAMLAYRKRVAAETEFLATAAEDVEDDLEAQAAFIRRANAADGLCVTALADDAMIAMLNFGRDRRRKLRHRGWVGMTVLRAHWGRGVGSALVRTLLEWGVEQEGLEKIELSVFANNARAIALYRKFGFVEEGRRRRSFKLAPDRYADEILMARFLDEPATAQGERR